MSDLGFTLPTPRINLFEALSGPGGFQPDARYGALPAPDAVHAAGPEPDNDPALQSEPEIDPMTAAFSEGFETGYRQAEAEAQARAAANADAQQGLSLAFARLDAQLEEELRLRLRDTVAALCESALAPLATDEDALMRRIDRAVSMLARVDDDRILHLHPEDIRLIAPRLAEEWQVEPDPRLERGTIRIESANGGVEDGPATWRLAISEALHQC